jgi:Ca-activated chloride channel family protein
MLGWAVALAVGGIAAKLVWDYMQEQAGKQEIVWHHKLAPWLAFGALLIGWVAFHLRRQRTASMAFSRVGELAQTRASLFDLFVGIPGALRMICIAGIAVALGRPQTFREITLEKDSVDVLIVFDLSKSMEESDLPRNRLDAAQRVVRKFLKSPEVKNDRVGLVVFAQRTMVQCPMTTDKRVLDTIVASMEIGDIPEYGTAIGDGLGLALQQLKKRDRCEDDHDCAEGFVCEDTHRCKSTDPDDPDKLRSKVVILLSDGDSNVAEHFDPTEAARLAREMKVKVFTILIGSENAGYFGGMGTNPQTMKDIASTTGGEYFNASDQEKFEDSFHEVRKTLAKTKRISHKILPDKELFWPWLLVAAAAVALELALALTRFRRFP